MAIERVSCSFGWIYFILQEEGGFCVFGEHMQAKVIGIKDCKKSDIHWKEALCLGRDSDTEATGIIVAKSDGVIKVRTVSRFAPSEQWKQAPIQALNALPWKPKTEGDFSTDFSLPPPSKDSEVLTFGRIRAPPGATSFCNGWEPTWTS